MRAGPLTTAVVLLRTVYVTLKISVITIVDVYRGTYNRSKGDARLRWWSRRLTELIALRCEVFGLDRFAPAPGRPTILMSNHQSLYDVPLIFLALPGSIRMLTKRELFRVPIWGRGMRAGEFVSIDRHNRAQAVRDLAEARRMMEDGIVLWIAPEGTRSRNGRLGALKKGGFILAIETGALVVPIGIRGAADVLPAGTFRRLQLGRKAEVHVGEPIDASAYTPEQRGLLMQDVARRICELADIEPASAPAGRDAHAGSRGLTSAGIEA